MRVIAGALKGRRLLGPEDDSIRPTSDRLRETLFNVLGPWVAGVRVLDGFGGTGAVAIEALSRGATEATIFETATHAIRIARQNIAALGLDSQCTVLKRDLLKSHGTEAFDFVFLDPPYDVASLDDVVTAGAPHLAHEGRLVLEHRRSRVSPTTAGRLTRVRLLEAGDSALSFYR